LKAMSHPNIKKETTFFTFLNEPWMGRNGY
jgi:hypothetical protein